MIEYYIIVAVIVYLLASSFLSYVSIKVAPKPLTLKTVTKSVLAGLLFPVIFIWWVLTSD